MEDEKLRLENVRKAE